MSNPIEELKKSKRYDPLAGLNIEDEYEKIKSKKSKLSKLNRKRVVWAKETNDQLNITNEAKDNFEIEQSKLREMLKNKPE